MLVIIWCRIFCVQFLLKYIKIKICRTIILPGHLYACETWSLMLREFKDRVPKENEVTGKWRRLHNEELNDL